MFLEILAVFAFIFDNQKESRFLKKYFIIPVYSFKSGLAFTPLLSAAQEPVRADLVHLIIGCMSMSYSILGSSFFRGTGHLCIYGM